MERDWSVEKVIPVYGAFRIVLTESEDHGPIEPVAPTCP